MSESKTPANIAHDETGNPLYRRLRPWGKYAFVSSILLVVFLVSCVILWIATFSFTETNHFLSFLFYATIGFCISSLVFAAMAFGAGRDKLYAGLSLLGPAFLVFGIIMVRFFFGAS